MRITRVLVTETNFKDNLKRLFHYTKTNLDRAPCTPTLDSCTTADCTAIAAAAAATDHRSRKRRRVANIPAWFVLRFSSPPTIRWFLCCGRSSEKNFS